MSVNVHRFTGNVENKFRLCGEILTHICLSMIRILESNDWSSIRSLWIQFIGVFISSLSLDERHLGREEFPVSTPRVFFFAFLWNIRLSTIYYSYFFCYILFYLLYLHCDPFIICIYFCQVTMKQFSFMIHLIVHKVESIISKKALIFTRWNVRCIRNKAICGSKSANQTRAEFIIKISVSRKPWVNKWISVESTWISLKISQNNARLQLIWSSSL